MSRSDEIDELVSSVRNFVAHKDSHRMTAPKPDNKLVLTPDTRLSDAQVRAIDAEWETELRALEAAGAIAPGQAASLSLDELEEAFAKMPDDWEPAPVISAAPKNGFVGFDKDAAEPTPQATSPELTPEAQMVANVVDTNELESIIASKIGGLIDQDALRALVVKTVHEELTGELGERITRNVRKLVRREINRVITSRDLEGD